MKAGGHNGIIEGEGSLGSIFEPVALQSAIEQTLTRLLNAIKLGLLPPGSRLPAERELCQRLAISRSTLRQALQQMVSSGHLRAVRGRGGGTFVSDAPPPPRPSRDLVRSWREICDRRRAVELAAATLAAERATPDDVGRLRRLVDRMAETDEQLPGRDTLDRRFHICIAEMARSRPLLSMSVQVQGILGDLIAAVGDGLTQPMAHAQHLMLAEAIETGDEVRSLNTMAEHLRCTEDVLALALA